MSRAPNNSLVLTGTFGCQFWKPSLTDISHQLGFIHSGPQTAQGHSLRMNEPGPWTTSGILPQATVFVGQNDRYWLLQFCIHTYLELEEKKLFPTNSSYKISDKAFYWLAWSPVVPPDSLHEGGTGHYDSPWLSQSTSCSHLEVVHGYSEPPSGSLLGFMVGKKQCSKTRRYNQGIPDRQQKQASNSFSKSANSNTQHAIIIMHLGESLWLESEL